MSRLSKKPMHIPEGVSVGEEGGMLSVKGPKGERELRILPFVTVSREGGALRIARSKDTEQACANEGTMWALIRNALVGVTKGYMKRLVIEGVGYRAVAEGRKLTLTLGYSHPVYVEPPKGVDITVEKNVVTVSGIDKEKVGQVAAEIRSEREPEPYKGKGIRYEEEVVRRKAGKKAASPTV